jgi:hypothetical protein
MANRRRVIVVSPFNATVQRFRSFGCPHALADISMQQGAARFFFDEVA